MTHVALVGKMHAGKSSIARALVEHHGYTRVALADEVKSDVVWLLNQWLVNRCPTKDAFPYPVTRDWIEANKPTVRAFLQWFGTEWGRETISRALWIDRLLETVARTDGPVVCDDCRFINEAEALRTAGFVIVRVIRPELERTQSAGEQGIAGHASETEQERIVPHMTIWNRDRSVDELAVSIVREIMAGTFDEREVA